MAIDVFPSPTHSLASLGDMSGADLRSNAPKLAARGKIGYLVSAGAITAGRYLLGYPLVLNWETGNLE